MRLSVSHKYLPEPAVLDKSLFGLTGAVTASFKTRRTQEVTSTPLSASCDGRKRRLYCPFQKQEGARSFLPAQGLARGWGLWLHHICMVRGAKPPGSFLSTPCFLPIKHLKLRSQEIEPGSLMTGSKRVAHWTSETWYACSEIAGSIHYPCLLRSALSWVIILSQMSLWSHSLLHHFTSGP
jgi:hypothetical protein